MPAGRVYLCWGFILATNNGCYSQHPISPGPLSPSHHLAQEEAWPEAAELWSQDRGPCHLPLHFRAVIQLLPSPGLSQAAGWAFLGLKTPRRCLISPLAKAGSLHQETPALAWPETLPPPPLPPLCRSLEQIFTAVVGQGGSAAAGCVQTLSPCWEKDP